MTDAMEMRHQLRHIIITLHQMVGNAD